MEREARTHQVHDAVQQVDMPRKQVITSPPQQINGKEIGSTRMPGATVIRHPA